MECPMIIKEALSPKKYLLTARALSKKVRAHPLYPLGHANPDTLSKIVNKISVKELHKYLRMDLSKMRAKSWYFMKKRRMGRFKKNV